MKPKCCIDNKILKEVGQTAELLKIVAEENRLKILCTLKTGERCVCDIWQDLDIPQNLASHHLKVLKDAGLIDSRKDGLKMIYWINKKEMSKFNSLLNNFLQTYGE
ncbi:MAG: ArsR family transcriptional regulator [Parcubacteria group bacterium CG_4_10_14_0_8_um_filter_48_154]|nr:MAG: ArsR family transcriptional regulator [Parcubacteria group bacterium CG_4_10_14_0_8_um_filter_48_154]